MCCDITGGGIEGKGPCGQTFVSLHSLEDCVTLLIPASPCQTPLTPLPRAQHRGEPQIYERGRSHSEGRCTEAARDAQFTEPDGRAWALRLRPEGGAEGVRPANRRRQSLCLESVHEHPFSLGLRFTSSFPPPVPFLSSLPPCFPAVLSHFSPTPASSSISFLFPSPNSPSSLTFSPSPHLLSPFSSPELSSAHLLSPLSPSPPIAPFPTCPPSPPSPVLPVPSSLFTPPLAYPTFFSPLHSLSPRPSLPTWARPQPQAPPRRRSRGRRTRGGRSGPASHVVT